MIRRRVPLKRTPLKPPTLAQVQAYQQKPRTPIGKNGAPLKRVGRKTRREQGAWTRCKAAVKERSGGYCEANVPEVCPPWPHGAVHPHHIWPEDHDYGRHEPDRVLHVCTAAHDWAHREPDLASEAGIMRPKMGASQAPPDTGSLWPW